MGQVRKYRNILAPTGDVGWGKDFERTSEAQFNRTFSVSKALAFVDQIKHTLEKEAMIPPGEARYYTGLRHVFAEIDGMGKLYRGKRGKVDTAVSAVRFGKDYLGRVDSRYRILFGLLFDMYRHGLAHTHLTKSIKFRDSRNRWITVGWGLADEDHERPLHLRLEQRATRYLGLCLHVRQLVEDTLNAVNLYCTDLRNGGTASTLFRRFKRGHNGSAAVFREPPVAGPTRGRSKRGRSRRELLVLNRYSAPGITWIRRQVFYGRVLEKGDVQRICASAIP
ncbi:MAG: hypothetical protein L0215_18335 [Gemmataceae bacterium]|nr:hypothetical protein [Gemmataceae bacterium]